MHTRDQILDKIKDILVNEKSCDRDEISLTSNLEDDLGIDSLDKIEVGMSIERDFGISLNDDIISQAREVGQIVDHVEGVINQLETAAKN